MFVEVQSCGGDVPPDRMKLFDYAKRVAKLNHPAIIQVLRVCVDQDGNGAVVRRAVPEGWLSLNHIPKYLCDPAAPQSQIPKSLGELATACSIVLSLTEALIYLHREQFRGCRSLSWDDSVRVWRLDGDDWRFGFLPPMPDDVVAAREPVGFCGALAYAAPELIESGISPTAASDSFSLGMYFFELLCGVPVLRSSGFLEIVRELMAGDFRRPSDCRSGLPRELDDLVANALARYPSNRPSLDEWVPLLKQYGGRLLPAPRALEADETQLHPSATTSSRPWRLFDVLDGGKRPVDLQVVGRLISGSFGTIDLAILQKPEEPPRLDENVQFTVYRPKVVRPEEWYDLPAFAHLDELPLDACKEQPHPIEEVKRQAAQILGPQASAYRDSTEDSSRAVPRGGEITFLPEIEGVAFNPPQYTFRWLENVHRVDFRMRASAVLDGGIARGRMSVFLGAILIADVSLNIRVDRNHAAGPDAVEVERDAARRYRKIFASYSHKDHAIVEQCEHFAAALGDRYVRDWKDLRAGERWDDRLRQLIDEADVFQLFWSTNSMISSFVRREWEYALSLEDRPSFVRPVYWEDPWPEIPPDVPPASLRRIHFQRLSTVPAHLSPAACCPAPPSLDNGAGEESTTRDESKREEDFLLTPMEETDGVEAYASGSAVSGADLGEAGPWMAPEDYLEIRKLLDNRNTSSSPAASSPLGAPRAMSSQQCALPPQNVGQRYSYLDETDDAPSNWRRVFACIGTGILLALAVCGIAWYVCSVFLAGR